MADAATSAPKSRRKWWLLALGLLVVAIVAGLFEFHIIKIPRCDPAIQTEVDWPPTEFGFYEEQTANSLRPLDQAAFSPGWVSICNVAGAGTAQAIARVPANARFVVYQQSLANYTYTLYGNAEIPDTGDCVRVRPANVIEGLVVTADPSNANFVTIAPPAALQAGQTYMLTAGADSRRGVVFQVGAPE